MIAFTPLLYLLSFTAVALGIFVYKNNTKAVVNRVWLFLSLNIAICCIGFAGAISSTDKAIALFWGRFIYLGTILIPVSFLHFVIAILNIRNKKKVLKFGYIISCIFLSFTYTNLLIKDVEPKFNFKFYDVAGQIYPFFVAFFLTYVIYAHYILFKTYRILSGPKRNQIKYIILASLVGFTGGTTAFLLVLNVNIYPAGIFALFFYIIIITYAIVKHRLMQIEVIIKKTLVFAGLFMFVSMSFVAATFLAQEFLAVIMGANTKWVAFALSMLIITLGIRPLEKWLIALTDRFLFQRKYDYQQTLKEASEGMTLVTDMKKLLNFIVRIATKKVRLKSAVIFQYEDGKDRYILRIRRGTHRRHTGYCLDKNNELVTWLIDHKEPLLYDEIEDWLRSVKILRKEKGLREKLTSIKEELEGIDGVVCVPSFSKGQLIGFLVLGEKLSGDIYTQEDVRLLSTLANSAAIAVENAKNFMELKRMREHDRERYIQTVLALAQTVDEKDSYTHGHLEDVCSYGLEVAKELENSSEFNAVINRDDLETALRLHDIGKIGVPDAILHKNGKLKASEWKIMKQHCEIGARIVEPLEKLRNVGNIIKHHQEKYDGSGYPDRLKGEDIPIESRIIAVVDAYHAMVSDRPYRKALSEEIALTELRKNIGTQFDPVVVGAFFRAYERGKIKRT